MLDVDFEVMIDFDYSACLMGYLQTLGNHGARSSQIRAHKDDLFFPETSCTQTPNKMPL